MLNCDILGSDNFVESNKSKKKLDILNGGLYFQKFHFSWTLERRFAGNVGSALVFSQLVPEHKTCCLLKNSAFKCCLMADYSHSYSLKEGFSLVRVIFIILLRRYKL